MAFNLTPIVIDQPNVAAASIEIEELSFDASSMVVDCDERCQAAGLLMVQLKESQRRAEEKLFPSITAAHKAHKAMTSLRNELTDPLKAAILAIKGKVVAYRHQQEALERKRQAEERRKEEGRRLQEAALLEKEGLHDEANEVLVAPPPPQIIAPPPPKTNGVAMVKVWRWKTVDPDKIPREYLVADNGKIGQVVRAMKGQTNIPGIEAYSEENVRVSAR